MRNNGLPKYNSQTIKPGSQLGESDVQLPDRKAMSMADDKIPYSPESVKYSSMTAYNQSQVKMSQFKVDHEVRTTHLPIVQAESALRVAPTVPTIPSLQE